jgi:hypothetical protein
MLDLGTPAPPRWRFVVKCRQCGRKFNTNIFESDCPFCYVEHVVGAMIVWPEGHEYAPSDVPTTPLPKGDDIDEAFADWTALSKIG